MARDPAEQRGAFILFTIEGERVPVIVDRYNTPSPKNRQKPYCVVKHGWKTVRTWMPGFFVTRLGRGYRLWIIAGSNRGVINGSIAQLRAYDWQPDKHERDFPNVAAVEVYLRTIYGQS